MFLLVSVRQVGAHPDELQPSVSIQSSINLGKTFPRISRIQIIPSTQILARVFVYLPPFISQILDFICRMVLIFILIYFEWRDSENQQYTAKAEEGLPTSDFQLPTSNFQLPTSNFRLHIKRSWHTYRFTVVFVSGRQDLPSDSRAYSLKPFITAK